MSEHEESDSAAWKLYMENYGSTIEIDSGMNTTPNSSSSSSNTIMHSHHSNGLESIQNENSMSNSFFNQIGGQGNVLTSTSNNNITCENIDLNLDHERSAEVEFISSLFPGSRVGTEEHPIGMSYGRDMSSLNMPADFLHSGNGRDDIDNESTDEEAHVIASMDRLQQLMDNRMENFTRTSGSDQNIMSSLLLDRFNTTCRLSQPHELLHRSSCSILSNSSNSPSADSSNESLTRRQIATAGDPLDLDNSRFQQLPQSTPNTNNPKDNNNSSSNVMMISDDDEDSLDQYLQSYRQQSASDLHNNNFSDNNPSIISQTNINTSANPPSSFNLDDEWRRLSQPRHHDTELPDFLMADLPYTPFSTVENFYSALAAEAASNNSYDAASATVPSCKSLRSNLNRLNSGLSRCEEKAENVQQMLQQLQGAIRSSNAISVSNFTHRCFELSQRLDATLSQQNSVNPESSSSTLEAVHAHNEERNQPLNYTLEPEYAEWEADSTLNNGAAYLNFAFEYDDPTEGGIMAAPMSNHSSHSHHEGGLSAAQRENVGGILRRLVQDLTPSARDFHISIGYPVDDVGGGGGVGNANVNSGGMRGGEIMSDSNLIMIADNPQSFPRNLIGEDTPLPFYVHGGGGDNNAHEHQVDASGQDSGVNSEEECEDSGIGATEESAVMSSQMSSTIKPTPAVESESLESVGGSSSNHNTNDNNAPISTEVTGNEDAKNPLKLKHQQASLSLVDIENFSDVLWQQQVVPPAIDFSDVEAELEELKKIDVPSESLKASGKFSDEDIAQIQKMVKEELAKDCSLSVSGKSSRGDEEEEVGAGGDQRCSCKKGGKDTDFSDDDEIVGDRIKLELYDEDYEEELEEEEREFPHEVGCLLSDKEEGSEFRSEKECDGELEVESEDKSELFSLSNSDEQEEGQMKSSEEKDPDAGGDTTSCVLEASPSRISGLKAGLKSLKLKMCSCFNGKTINGHVLSTDPSYPNHSLSNPTFPVERR